MDPTKQAFYFLLWVVYLLFSCRFDMLFWFFLSRDTFVFFFMPAWWNLSFKFAHSVQLHGFTCGVDDLVILPNYDIRRKEELEGEDVGEEAHCDFVKFKRGEIGEYVMKLFEVASVILSFIKLRIWGNGWETYCPAFIIAMHGYLCDSFIFFCITYINFLPRAYAIKVY